ncbi:MAG: D-alanyl-D-alanine carboxypeptidase family protein [Thermodesulfobacteriota bacterium]|nr:D-alanyl-D-alanine carboxypeptidase family protein [Thermodesulfobacteriota bacterium]
MGKFSKNYYIVFIFLSFISIFPQEICFSQEKPPFKVYAESAVLLDGASGQVIYEYMPNLRIEPASLTKIVTLDIVFDKIKDGSIKLEDEVVISKKAWQTHGSKMFIEVGKKVNVEDLIKGVAIVSGNDSSVALAEHISGVEEVFVNKMNEKIKSMGLINTKFHNSSGLPHPEQYTTALDMAFITWNHLQDNPESLIYYKMKGFEFNGINQPNRNGLLWRDNNVDGVKTGHIESAGFHLVATAKRDLQRFIAVVLGTKDEFSRENEAYRLLEYGFKNFVTASLFTRENSMKVVKVWKGKRNQVALWAEEEGIITVPKEGAKKLTLKENIPEIIYAPIKKGDPVGEIFIYKDEKPIKKIRLVAGADVAEAGFFKCLWHSIIIFFKSLFTWL